MSDSDPPILYEVVVYTLHRISEEGDAEKIEFDAVAQHGQIRLTDIQTKQKVLVDGVLLTRREDHVVGINPGTLFAVTQNSEPFPIFRRTDDGRYEADESTLVMDVQMTIWTRR